MCMHVEFQNAVNEKSSRLQTKTAAGSKSYLYLRHRVLFYNAYCCLSWTNSFNSNVHKIEKNTEPVN